MAARPGTVTAELMLDRFVPRYDLSLVHSGVFRVPPADCLHAVLSLDLFASPLIRALIGARGLPWRLERLLRRRPSPQNPASSPTFRFSEMPQHGWLLLGETPDLEMVLGTVGQPWKPKAGTPSSQVTPETFRDFDEPRFLKIATSIRVNPYGATSTILTLETRAVMTDDESRRRFAPYWRVVGPFSHLVRWRAMRMLRRALDNP